jgi:hypothetical protein
MIAELGQQTWSQEVTCSRKGVKDESVGVLPEELTESGLGLVPPNHLRENEFG